MKQDKKNISILTVFYKDNCADYFLRYLNSINKFIDTTSKDFNIQVYILDNSPVGQLIKYISNNRIKISKNIFIFENNIGGFASSNNYLAKIAYKKKKCDYFFILNPDTEIKNLSFLAIKNILNDIKFFSVDFKQYPFEHPKAYTVTTLETSWCSGACELVDAKRFFEIGGFEDRFFMYAEDVDLSWKAWEAGFKCFYQPDSLIIHHCYGYGKDMLFRRHWGIRNGLLMVVKHGNLSQIISRYKLLFKICWTSIKNLDLKDFVSLIKPILSGFLNSFYYLNYFFKNKKRPSFASFYGFKYAKLMNKYEPKK